jgi:hypothetical protein
MQHVPLKALAAVALLGLAVAACFVNRPSEEFVCSTDTDCTPDRRCTSGYCVERQCPSDCDSCDEDQKSCTMDCSSDDECGSVNCPNGWTCTINCVGSDACDDVSCAGGSKCTINCAGDNACNDVSCREACSCDLTCITGACDTMTCPTANGGGGERCTTDGMNGTPCLSTAAGCAKC